MKIAESWARTAGYKKMGFAQIEKPRTTMHSTMNSFYLKEL